MGRKQQFQTRLDPDVAARVEEYAENHNISNSEATRRLVEEGVGTLDNPTREEIAADLRRINESVEEVANDLNDLRADLDDTDEQEMATARMNETARQTGTILMLLLLGFLTAAEVGLL